MRPQRKDFHSFVKSKFAELGQDGFSQWWNTQDEYLYAAIEDALTDPSFGLQPHQISPEGQWTIWFVRMGRGGGKTYAASCEVNRLAEEVFSGGSGILVGATHKDVRDTMIEGESGILATARPGFEPRFNRLEQTLTWPNGSKAIIRTADNPEDIRGPTLNWGWGDELVKWKSEKSFDNLRRCVRNKHENGIKLILTTTPQSAKQWIKDIEAEDGCVTTTGKTFDNIHMDEAFLARARKEAEGGSARAQEEVLGEWVTGESQLWDKALLDHCRTKVSLGLNEMAASMERRLLSVDPSGGKRDQTGIILGGERGDNIHILRDYSEKLNIAQWSDKVVRLYQEHDCDALLIEVNNNAAAVDLLQLKCPNMRIEPVFVDKSKWNRAEYAFGFFLADEVKLYGHFPELEQQLVEWERDNKESPDRGDAMTQLIRWAKDPKNAGLRNPVFQLSGLKF